MNFLKHKITFLILFITSITFAGDRKDFFAGGMAGHFGYSQIKNEYGNFSGPAFGLGGMLHLYVIPFLRIGSGGASSWMNYDYNGFKGSHMRLSYGGITTELSIPVKEWRFSTGLFIGGGSYSNSHIISKQTDDNHLALYIEKGTFIISPLLCIERNLNKSLKFFIMSDYLIGKGIGETGHFGGPKFLIGILFRK